MTIEANQPSAVPQDLGQALDLLEAVATVIASADLRALPGSVAMDSAARIASVQSRLSAVDALMLGEGTQ